MYFVIVPAAFVTDFTPGPRQSGYADRQVRYTTVTFCTGKGCKREREVSVSPGSLALPVLLQSEIKNEFFFLRKDLKKLKYNYTQSHVTPLTFFF